MFIWIQYLQPSSLLTGSLTISPVVAGLAGLVIICSVGAYFWTPKPQLVRISASIYALLVITTGLLVVQSGGLDSPFIALWMGVSVFAGLYGLGGLLGVLAAVNLYIVYGFFAGFITRGDLIVAAIAGELPMFISYILWHGRETIEEAHDQNMTKLNKSLEQESSKADAIIEAIGDGVIVVNQTGEVLVINPAAQQMTGWSADDALHLHFESVLKLQDSEGNPIQSALNPVSRVLNVGQQVREKELCVITKSGKKVYAAFVVSPMGTSGEGAIAVFRDITKERNEEHAQAEFISTASHEMRTPVASIEGYLGLALNPNTATIDDKARDFITKAHASAQHLGHLFQDLLDVSKADDGRLKENPKVVDVVDFTRELIEGLKSKAEEKDLKLEYKPDSSKSVAGTTVISPVLYAHVDKDHLREVLDNLIENGIKYTPKGSVTIDTTASDEYVRISIQDSGLGIPAEDLPHLFQKFYRVDNTDTREIGGTGLGLYLCRKLIEAMDGRIWVESEYKKGSTFYVEIPRLERIKASELMAKEAEAPAVAPQATEESNHETHDIAQALGTIEASAEIPTPPPETPTPAPAPQIEAPIQPAPVEPMPVTPAPSEPHRFGAVSYNPAAPAQQMVNPEPTPVASAPLPQAPVTTPAPARANIPLAALERNPSQYTSRRPEQRQG